MATATEDIYLKAFQEGMTGMNLFCGCRHSILGIIPEVPNPVIESTVMAEAKLPPRAQHSQLLWISAA